jgi:hypothetical protein
VVGGSGSARTRAVARGDGPERATTVAAAAPN